MLRYIKNRGLLAKSGHKYILHFLFVMQDKYYDAHSIQQNTVIFKWGLQMLYSARDRCFQKFLQILYNSILGSSGWNHLGILRELFRRRGILSAEVFIFNASAIKINIQKHWREHKGSPGFWNQWNVWAFIASGSHSCYLAPKQELHGFQCRREKLENRQLQHPVSWARSSRSC